MKPAITGVWALSVLLAGCSGLPNAHVPRPGAAFVPDANGLAVVGSPQRIDFGRAPSGVITVLNREVGPGRDLGVSTCPTGIVTQRAWRGLVLSFTDERFVGWRNADGSAGQTCSVAP